MSSFLEARNMKSAFVGEGINPSPIMGKIVSALVGAGFTPARNTGRSLRWGGGGRPC